MGIDESEISRLLAGEVPADDPELGKVSSFLSSLEAACPPSSVAAIEDHHLAVVAREVRLVGESRQRDRRGTAAHRFTVRTRRALAATGAGLLVVFTAGVGVASALGVSPLELVPHLVKSWTSPEAPTRAPQPSDHPSGGPANGQQDSTKPPSMDPTAVPTPAQPTPSVPTPGNCGNGKGDGNATCTNGKSGDPKPSKSKPTAKPTSKDKGSHGKGDDKGDKGNSGNGNSGKGKGKPTPEPTP